MGASAPLVCAHSTMVYAASEIAPPADPDTADEHQRDQTA
jgi:hypothetical protein